MERNERVTRKMQADSRLGGIRALQILGEDESARSNPHSYPTHYRCKMDPENKNKFNPWPIVKSSTQENGSQPETMRTNRKPEIVIEI